MSGRYGIQSDAYGTPGLANDPRVPRRPGDPILWYVVDHNQTNAWGQSVPVTSYMGQHEAEQLAIRKNTSCV